MTCDMPGVEGEVKEPIPLGSGIKLAMSEF